MKKILIKKLNNEKQENRELKEFASTIEQLLYELTLGQPEHEDTLVESFDKVNEKIAINTFANGLRNSEPGRTITKQEITRHNFPYLVPLRPRSQYSISIRKSDLQKC